MNLRVGVEDFIVAIASLIDRVENSKKRELKLVTVVVFQPHVDTSPF